MMLPPVDQIAMRQHTHAGTEHQQTTRLAPPRTAAGFVLTVVSTALAFVTTVAPAVGATLAVGVLVLAVVGHLVFTGDSDLPGPPKRDVATPSRT